MMEDLGHAVSLMLLLVFILLAVSYIIHAFIYYRLAKKAGLDHEAWFAFVPVLQFILYLHIIGRSGWNIFWLFVPVANFVFQVIWTVEFLELFGQHPLWTVTRFITPLTMAFYILEIYMAFSDDVQYKGYRRY